MMTSRQRLTQWASKLSGQRSDFALDYLVYWYDGGRNPLDRVGAGYEGVSKAFANRIANRVMGRARMGF